MEPDLPICDPHHHLWRRPNNPYLLDDFMRDASGGHRIVSSVAVECGAMYRDGGPPELQPVGETEFLEDIATENSRAGNDTAVAAAIVAYADLALGDAVAGVLEAHREASPTRLRGIRYSTMWDASDSFRSVPRPGLLRDAAVRKGFACLQRQGLSFDAWLYHPRPRAVELGGIPRHAIILSIGRPSSGPGQRGVPRQGADITALAVVRGAQAGGVGSCVGYTGPSVRRAQLHQLAEAMRLCARTPTRRALRERLVPAKASGSPSGCHHPGMTATFARHGCLIFGLASVVSYCAS